MKKYPLFSLLLSMFIFGSIGIFRRYIPLPSGTLAFSRGIIGALFIIVLLIAMKKPFDFKKAKKHFVPLFISGALMGFNWILLFEAYNYTTVAAATLSYYMAPLIIIAASPFVFGEKLSARKILCVFAAVLGMIPVSGILSTGFSLSEIKGILFGLSAAFLYVAVVIMNKKFGNVPAYERTIIQLLSSSASILPYILLIEDFSVLSFDVSSVSMLILVGVVHTGVAYVLYFGSIGHLKAQTAAIFSYIDPVTAIILSAAVLGEKIGGAEITGAVLILGAAVISELPEKQKTESTL